MFCCILLLLPNPGGVKSKGVGGGPSGYVCAEDDVKEDFCEEKSSKPNY